MIEQELILLGLLRESPKHGYQIKKEIKEVFSVLAGIDLKSIYYPLSVLEKKGLVARQTLRCGKRPVRNVYALTSAGKTRFDLLLTKSFLDFKRPQFSLDLSLYFLSFINPRISKRRLKARVFILHQLAKSLKQMLRVFQKNQKTSLVRILNHNLQMLNTESQFLAELTKTL